MDTISIILDILKYTIPAVVVLISSSLIVRRFLITQTQRKQLAIFQEGQSTTLNLRLQAYERLVILIERISPRNLIPRLYDPAMTVFDLQQAMIFTITAEFEHNLSQQIYVSKNVWETVKSVKEQEINMVHQIGNTMDANAPAKELHARILDFVNRGDGESPTDVALFMLNDEVKKVLAYGSI